ncbi:MAG: hypothetical protein WA941_01320 [Nitrososphaeraceae archaeon]
MASWGYLLGDLNLNTDFAVLDWPTGIIRLNCTYKEFERLTTKIDLDMNESCLNERELAETISHESFHYMQMCTSGFLYSFVVDLFESIGKCVPRGEFKDLKDMFDIIDPQSPAAIKIQNNCRAQFDNKGPKGLTVRSIVESAAMLVQKRMHRPNLNAQRYLEILDSLQLDEEYRSAYDVTLKYLGENAFNSYPFLSYLSLCTSHPTQALVYLCQSIEGQKIYNGVNLNRSLFADLLKRSSLEVIGSSTDVARGKGIQHPIYFETIHHLNELIEQNRLNIFEYLVAPHLLPNSLAQPLVRPSLFKKNNGKYYAHLPESVWPEMSKDQRRDKFEVLLCLFAASARILGIFAPPP